MLRSFRELAFIEKELSDPIMTLPCVWILGKIILPECFFVAINFRAGPSVAPDCAEQKRDNSSGYNLYPPWARIQQTRHARTEQSDQRNISEILEMICDQGSTARISHAQQSKHG